MCHHAASMGPGTILNKKFAGTKTQTWHIYRDLSNILAAHKLTNNSGAQHSKANTITP